MSFCATAQYDTKTPLHHGTYGRHSIPDKKEIFLSSTSNRHRDGTNHTQTFVLFYCYLLLLVGEFFLDRWYLHRKGLGTLFKIFCGNISLTFNWLIHQAIWLWTIDGLVEDCAISSALSLEIPHFYTKPTMRNYFTISFILGRARHSRRQRTACAPLGDLCLLRCGQCPWAITSWGRVQLSHHWGNGALRLLSIPHCGVGRGWNGTWVAQNYMTSFLHRNEFRNIGGPQWAKSHSGYQRGQEYPALTFLCCKP